MLLLFFVFLYPFCGFIKAMSFIDCNQGIVLFCDYSLLCEYSFLFIRLRKARGRTRRLWKEDSVATPRISFFSWKPSLATEEVMKLF